MSVSMYEISVPMFISMLENLSSILKKGERFAEKRKIDKDIFINARLDCGYEASNKSNTNWNRYD